MKITRKTSQGGYVRESRSLENLVTCARKPRVWTTARTGKCDRDGYCAGERGVGVEKGVRGVLGVMEDRDTEGIMEN